MTEGLLTYFDDETVDGLWERLARVLGRFSNGGLPGGPAFCPAGAGIAERAFDVLLGAFVRGKVHAYRGDEATAAAALRGAGFGEARLHRGDEHPAAAGLRGDPGAGVVCIIEATAP